MKGRRDVAAAVANTVRVTVRWVAATALTGSVCFLLASCRTQPALERGIAPVGAASDSVARFAIAQAIHRFYTINGQLGRRSPILRVAAACSRFTAPCLPTAYAAREDSASHRTMQRSAIAMANQLSGLEAKGISDPMIAEVRFFVHAFVRAAPQLARNRPACDSTPWWCDALDGLARHRTADVLGAEQSFARMFLKMDSATACSWRSLPEVPGPRCDFRDDNDPAMWWLGDPLWIEPGNDRWTEHLARRTMFELLVRQEDLLRAHGFIVADAVYNRELDVSMRLVRALRWGLYDVSYRNLGAPIADTQHRAMQPAGYLRWHPDREWTRLFDVAAPHYEFLSVHAPDYRKVAPDDSSGLAAWPAAVPAFNFCLDDRSIACRRERPGAPPIREHYLFGSDGTTRISPSYFGSNESYGRSFRFRTVRAQQVVTLRRDSARELLVAFQTDASPARVSLSGAAFSENPADSIRIMPGRAYTDGAVRVRTSIPNRGGVISLEAIAYDSVALRHRFYWPQDTMFAPGAISASRIVMLSPLPGGVDAEIAADAIAGDAAREYPALERLLPRVEVRRTEGVELYWEVYGAAGDTAPDIALEVRRSDGSLWQAVRSLLGGRDGLQVTLAVTNPRRVVRTAAYQGFQVTLFPRDLAPGPYELRVLVRRDATQPYVRGEASRMVVP